MLYRRVGIFRQKTLSAQNKSRRAIGTLKCVMVDKGLLNRVQLARIAQSLDGGDLFFFGEHREQNARAHWLAIEKNRARAAHADTATFASAEQLVFGA